MQMIMHKKMKQNVISNRKENLNAYHASLNILKKSKCAQKLNKNILQKLQHISTTFLPFLN